MVISFIRYQMEKAVEYTSIEICAGGGGQALGLERAGFRHLALIEIEDLACKTLKINRPHWNVICGDIAGFSASGYKNVDLLAGGVPCPPFSIAGKQLGSQDERDLFPQALRLVKECMPRAIMLENVKGILSSRFAGYRAEIIEELCGWGYESEWKLVNASDYGVSQLRPRAVLVALKKGLFDLFEWEGNEASLEPLTVGELLYDEMSSLNWQGAKDWKSRANKIAPTLVGGSKKHGGADLGPTRARLAWETLGINGKGLADLPPDRNSVQMPKLTLQMTALIQGFPSDWRFAGKKTPAYRQIGNAFPPPVAEAIGRSIIRAFERYENRSKEKGFKSQTA